MSTQFDAFDRLRRLVRCANKSAHDSDRRKVERALRHLERKAARHGARLEVKRQESLEAARLDRWEEFQAERARVRRHKAGLY